MARDSQDGDRLIVDNRKARHKYEVLDTVEAGVALLGTEVKSLREGKVHLDEAYARIDGGEAWLVGSHIAEYSCGNRQNHLPTRRRKLLLKKGQIRKLEEKAKQKGLTLVPLKMYFNERGLVKVTVGVCRGKKTHDKRQATREKDAHREMREHG